jgi:3-phosphoglycerate kinase
MAYTFALAQGKKVGKSLVELDKINLAKETLSLATQKKVEFLLPIDTRITDYFDFDKKLLGQIKTVEGDIPEDWEGIDIGPKTIKLFKSKIKSAKTILWNGPMGVFEIIGGAEGTFAIAKAVAESKSLSIIGGGDSITAVKSGYVDAVTFMSTCGGASLEFLEGKPLPGVEHNKITS